MLTEHISQLCQEFQLDPPDQVDEKTFRMQINPNTTLTIRDLDPGAFYFGKIAPLYKERREELFIYLMRANLLGQGTGGAVIGLDAEEKHLTLSFTLSYEANYQTFKETLEDFTNYLTYWQEEVDKKRKEALETLL